MRPQKETGMSFPFETTDERTSQWRTSREWVEAALARNASNRVVKQAKVRELTRALRAGQWKSNGDTICFDRAGRLIDGQHRLLAFLAAEVFPLVRVVTGLAEDAYTTIDRGTPKSITDITRHDRRIVEPCTLYARIHLMHQLSPTVADVVPIVEGPVGAALLHLITACGSTRKTFSTAPIRLAAALRLVRGKGTHYVTDQYRHLVMNSLDRSQAIHAFACQIEDNKRPAVGSTRDLDRLVRAWIAFDPARHMNKTIQVRDIAPLMAEIRDVWSPPWATAGVPTHTVTVGPNEPTPPAHRRATVRRNTPENRPTP
jgi:hypothetical protein